MSFRVGTSHRMTYRSLIAVRAGCDRSTPSASPRNQRFDLDNLRKSLSICHWVTRVHSRCSRLAKARTLVGGKEGTRSDLVRPSGRHRGNPRDLFLASTDSLESANRSGCTCSPLIRETGCNARERSPATVAPTMASASAMTAELIRPIVRHAFSQIRQLNAQPYCVRVGRWSACVWLQAHRG